MKKEHIPYIFLIVLTVVLIVLTFRVKGLEDDLRVYKINMNSRLDDIRMDVSMIYKNVEDRMKKEASLFTNVSFTIGELTDDSTVPVVFEIIPKKLTEDTEITLTLGDETVMLQRDGDIFRGGINVDIFENEGTPLATIITSAKETEYLEDVDLSLLYRKILPEFNADMAGGSTYNHNAKKLSVDHTFTVNRQAEGCNGVEFVKFTLVEEVNGKELLREDITDKVASSDGMYFCEYKKSYDVRTGDTLKIYVEAEDSLGYIHKRVAYHWWKNDSGAVSDVYYHGEAIYDKNGNMMVDNEYK